MKAKVAVVVGESMEKALVEGVGALQATTLVLGTSRAAAKPWYVFFSLVWKISALGQFLLVGAYCSCGRMVLTHAGFSFSILAAAGGKLPRATVPDIPHRDVLYWL